ncbi:hypothetical protein AB6T38_09330 [Aliiglaciecola sp. SL4]|uniref:hypothetical protein n=1 Tax=Aliiglaciecola sp. SL4 TaxID=3239806 RepID=UPI00355B6975
MDQQTKAQIDEYHLMIEEVLGGMDIMLSGINKRVSILENKIDTIIDNVNNASKVAELQVQVAQIKDELSSGLNLAFRKINEK